MITISGAWGPNSAKINGNYLHKGASYNDQRLYEKVMRLGSAVVRLAFKSVLVILSERATKARCAEDSCWQIPTCADTRR